MRKKLSLSLVGLLLSVAAMAVGPILGAHSICSGSTTTLSDTTGGGSWATSDSTIASITSTGVVTGHAAGVVTVYYFSGGLATFSLTVNPLPAAYAVTGGGGYCAGGSGVHVGLAGSQPGVMYQLYNGTSMVTTLTGTGSTLDFGLETAAGTYTVVATNTTTGCSNTMYSSAAIAVNPLPTVFAVAGGGSYCAGGTGVYLGVTNSEIPVSYQLYLGTTPIGPYLSASSGPINFGLETLAGTYTVLATNALTGCTNYMGGTATIVVNPLPSAITGPASVAMGSAITLTDSASGGTWSSSNTSVATVGASTGIVNGVAAGTCTMTYTLTTGCFVTRSMFVSGTTLPIYGTMHVCVGSTAALADSTTGGTWSSSNTAIASVTSVGVVTGVAAGTCTISYIHGTSVATASFTVYALPAAISGPTTVSVGGTITLTDVGGGTWSCSPPSAATIGASTGIVTGVSAGTAVVYYTLSTGCLSYVIITVSGTGGTTLPISGLNHICSGAITALVDSTPGGTWSSSNTAIATVTSVGVVTGVSAGTCTISYTVGTSTATISFTVYPAPAAIGGPITVAAGSTITLTDATAGGTWSSYNTSIATVNSLTGVVTGVSAGTDDIFYTMTTGCMVYVGITVTGPSTVLPVTGTLRACIGSTSALHDSTPGGTWSSSNTAIATVNATTGVVTGVAAGTCTITYAVGSAHATVSFTVYPTPAAITGLTTVSVGGTIYLSDATTGGAWISGNTAVATISSIGMLRGVAAGSVGIYYELTTGCSVYTVITVGGGGGTTLPITGTAHTCAGSTSALHDSTAGGVWSSSNTAIATVSSVGVVNGISAGTCTISYTHGTSVATISFTVYAPPASIAGSTSVMAGSSITLSDATPGGTWSSGNTSIATVNATTGVVTGVSAGTVGIYYTMSTGCVAYIAITVTGGYTLPISGTTHTCVGMTSALHDSTSGGTWSSSNTSIATVNATTGIVTGVAAGTCTISYTHGTSTVTTSFTVYAAPGTISGTTTVSVGGTTTLSDAPSGGGWSSSNTSIATVSSAGVVTGVSAGTVTIYYTLTTGCIAYVSVTVTGSGTFPISGTTHTCVGMTSALHDSTSVGTWTSSNTSIATVNATTGVVTGVSAGTCTISYTHGTSTVTTSFTVYAAPGAISGASTVSAGATTTLTDATTGGSWSSSNTSIATVNPTTGVVTAVSAGTVTIYYTMTTGCLSYKVITVTGTSGTLPITGTTHTCVGMTSALHDSTSVGTWTSSNTSIATVNATTGVVTGVSAGTCTISYTHGTSTVTTSFTVYAAPGAISGASTVSAGAATTLTDATTGGTWSSSNTSIATVNPSTGVVTGVSAGTVTIYYTMTTGCLSYKVITVTGTTGTLPITGTTHTCLGSTTPLYDSTSGGTWSSSNTSIATVNATTGVVTGVSAGTCTISYTHGASTVTTSFTVYAAPAAIAGTTTVSVGSTITLTDATPGGTWSSGNPSVATVSTAGVVTGVSAGTAGIYYVLSTGCGVYVAVTVTSGGTAPITGLAHTCVGTTSPLYDATTGGTWSSSNPSVATVSATTGVVTGVAAGACTISYTHGTSTATVTFMVYATPATISGSSSVCDGSAISLTDATSGGTWSCNDTAVATVGTGGMLTGLAAGTVTVYYFVGGCVAYKVVTVNPLPAAITGSSSVLTAHTTTLSDATGGGYWFSGNTTIATVNPTTGVVTGVAAGTVNIYYSIGGCTVSKTITVIYYPSPYTPIVDRASAQLSPSKPSTVAGKEAPGAGVQEEEAASILRLYPNPTSGNINLQWQNQSTGDAAIVVTDMVGREVFQTTLTMTTENGQAQVDLSSLKDGIYIISVKSNSNLHNEQLIIRH